MGGVPALSASVPGTVTSRGKLRMLGSGFYMTFPRRYSGARGGLSTHALTCWSRFQDRESRSRAPLDIRTTSRMNPGSSQTLHGAPAPAAQPTPPACRRCRQQGVLQSPAPLPCCCLPYAAASSMAGCNIMCDTRNTEPRERAGHAPALSPASCAAPPGMPLLLLAQGQLIMLQHVGAKGRHCMSASVNLRLPSSARPQAHRRSLAAAPKQAI